MSRPKAYCPEHGYKYQILCRNQRYDRSFEHCDYAKDRTEKNYLVGEYKLAYGSGYEFISILLPEKYWPKAEVIPAHEKLSSGEVAGLIARHSRR